MVRVTIQAFSACADLSLADRRVMPWRLGRHHRDQRSRSVARAPRRPRPRGHHPEPEGQIVEAGQHHHRRGDRQRQRRGAGPAGRSDRRATCPSAPARSAGDQHHDGRRRKRSSAAARRCSSTICTRSGNLQAQELDQDVLPGLEDVADAEEIGDDDGQSAPLPAPTTARRRGCSAGSPGCRSAPPRTPARSTASTSSIRPITASSRRGRSSQAAAQGRRLRAGPGACPGRLIRSPGSGRSGPFRPARAPRNRPAPASSCRSRAPSADR